MEPLPIGRCVTKAIWNGERGERRERREERGDRERRERKEKGGERE